MLDNILFFERPYRHFLCVDSLDQAVAAQAAAVLGTLAVGAERSQRRQPAGSAPALCAAGGGAGFCAAVF